MPACEARLAGTSTPEWKNWLEARLLVAGAVLVLAAFIYFFAWNWQRLPAAFRLFLVQGLFVLSVAGVLLARVRGTRSAALAADLALTSACVLIGVFWAVFGQIYQTGANAWKLFALWSLCVLPWLAAGFSLSLWILWIAVSNLALFLWSVQDSLPGAPWSGPSLFADLSMPLLFSFCAWSACALASLKRNFSRWHERSAAAFALLFATQGLCLLLLDISGPRLLAFAPLPALAALGLIFFWSLHERDLFCLHLLALCGYFLLNCLLARLFKDTLLYEFTFMALVFVLANVGYTALLIKLLPHPRLPSSKAGPFRRARGDGGSVSPACPAPAPCSAPAHEKRTGSTGSLGRTFLLSVGGVLCGFFLLVFFVALLSLGSQPELSVLGGGLVALVVGALISRSTSGPFRRMFAFSISLAGLVMALFGLAEVFRPSIDDEGNAYSLAAAVLCAAVHIATPQPGTRFASAASFWLFAASAAVHLLEPATREFEPGALSWSAAVFLRIWLALCALPLAIRIWTGKFPRSLAPAAGAGLTILFLFQILHLDTGLNLLGFGWMRVLLHELLQEPLRLTVSFGAARPLLPPWGIPLLAFAAATALPRLRNAAGLADAARRALSIAAVAAFLCLSLKEDAAVMLCLLAYRAGASEHWTLLEKALFAIFLAALLWFCPAGVLFALCLLLLGHLHLRRVTTLAGWFWLTVFVFDWYYWMGLPFAQKALALGTTGALLLAGTLLVHFRGGLPGRERFAANAASQADAPTGTQRPDAPVSPLPPRPTLIMTSRRLALPFLLGLLCLCGFNWAVADKERLLESGEELLLALAPRDPRSLIQGDYMELGFLLSGEVRHRVPEVLGPEQRPPAWAYAILRRDERNIGKLEEVRLEPDSLQSGEIALPFRVRDAKLRLPHSFLFQEGLGGLYARACYGIFRCTPDGTCLLTGLADEDGRVIRPGDVPVAAMP